MRVGVYVDGFNLYYGGRGLFTYYDGKVFKYYQPLGWRWLDIRSLVRQLLAQQAQFWPVAQIERIVYCTARRPNLYDPSSLEDQLTYLGALEAAHSVTHIEYGWYKSKTRHNLMAREDSRGDSIVVTLPWSEAMPLRTSLMALPVKIQAARGMSGSAHFKVQHQFQEEKGSDVNVASHLLVDKLDDKIDAAIIISNDSDLAYPIHQMRARMPIGLVNPSRNPQAGKLALAPTDGVGPHWYRQLTRHDFRSSQLLDPVEDHKGKLYPKPAGW